MFVQIVGIINSVIKILNTKSADWMVKLVGILGRNNLKLVK